MTTDACGGRRWAALVAVGVAAFPVACGSDDPSSDGPQPSTSIALEALCEELATVDCARLAQCGLLEAPIDELECVRRQRGLWCEPVRVTLQSEVDNGRMTYSATAAAACRDAIGARDCGPRFDDVFISVEACRAMVNGFAGAGEPCTNSLACGDGLACALQPDCSMGICVALSANNEPCGIDLPCEPGLYCALTAMRCRAPADLGGQCDLALFGNSCRTGSFCDTSQPGQTVCAAARGRGSGCTSTFQCAQGGRCIANRCSSGLEGDGCMSEADCASGFRCRNNACVALGRTDEVCSTGRPCGEGLTCTSTAGQGLCRPLSAPGGACASDQSCYLGRCVDGVCEALADDGQPCTTAADCLPQRSCEGTCGSFVGCF